MPKIKAILFDNDGTLSNTYWAITTSFKLMMYNICSDRDPDVQKEIKLVGLPLRDQFYYFTDDEELIDKMYVDFRSYRERLNLDEAECFKGIEEMLKGLHDAGYFLGVVTSKPHAACEANLRANNIFQYFEYLQGLEDSDVHKPDPGVITFACNKIGFSPDEVIYVGDSPYDLRAGSGAGCKTCGVTWGGFFDRADLEPENPTLLIDKPAELVSLAAQTF